MLPADLQIAGLAMRDLKISSGPALEKIGGPTELEEAVWDADVLYTGSIFAPCRTRSWTRSIVPRAINSRRCATPA